MAATTNKLELRFFGDAVLAKRAKPIAAVTEELREFARSMIDTMFARNGIGLAAPQVGHSLRLITLGCLDPMEPLPLRATPGERLLAPMMPLPLLNPELVDRSAACTACNEGCLSVPEIWGEVQRPAVIYLRAMLLDGRTIEVECGGMLGRCLQHEIDHLDGVLFVDRLAEEERERVAEALHELREKTQRELKARRK